MLASAAPQAAAVAGRAGSKRRAAGPLPAAVQPARRSARSTRASAARCKPATRASGVAAGGRSRAAPPASEVNLGELGKLRAVCQLFFPARVTPRQALKERVSCVLTLDRASLLPEEETSIEERVRHVMEEYVELQDGFTGADFDAPKLESTVDAATGCQTYTLAYRVKRTRVAVDSGLRERDEDAAWDHALRA